jgi:hypothetical protein
VEATGKGAMEFLEYAVSNGLINPNTAGGLRAATKEVLRTVDGEGWEATDLTTIDVEDYGARFERLSTGRYKPDSVAVYKARFRNAISLLLAYLENPSGWRYKPARPAASRSKASSNGKTAAGRANGARQAQETPELPKSPGTITYPFVVRRDVIATLVLPVDLTKPEAKRLSVFIDSIAIETPLLLTASAPARGDQS